MDNSKSKKLNFIIVIGIIVIAICYQLLNKIPISIKILDPISVVFNAALAGGLSLFILNDELLEWFKHFSLKWILIGIPVLVIISIISGNVWKIISRSSLTENDINSILTWKYVLQHVPLLLIGEELLCIPFLYVLWKKIGIKFWQASLLCSTLFAVWHLSSYGFNLLQVLVTIIPSRLFLNYLFKKTNSIWVTWIVHLSFDIISFLPILLF